MESIGKHDERLREISEKKRRNPIRIKNFESKSHVREQGQEDKTSYTSSRNRLLMIHIYQMREKPAIKSLITLEA